MNMMYYDSRGKDEGQQANYHQHIDTSSASSSPSHEFSFTICLNTNSSYYTKEISVPDRTKSFASSFIDLSPADDIFFHGHLLPLHHLSHFPPSISPPLENEHQIKQNSLEHQPYRPTLVEQDQSDDFISSSANHYQETRLKANTTQKSFPFFGLQKWKQNERQQRTKRKLKLDNVSHTLKRYIRMVRPFLSFRKSSRREGKTVEFERQSYSFSGPKKEKRVGMDMGYSSSAPASIWTSPTNSGHLVATPETIHSSITDSTMDELQAAIQAAIAHCKNSIAIQDHNQNP